MPRWLLIIIILLLVLILVFLVLHLTGKTRRKIETSIDIAASPEQIWAALTAFDNYGDWGSPLRFTKAPSAVGQALSFHFVDAEGKPGMEITPTLLAMTPDQELRWQGRLWLPGIFDGQHAFVLTSQQAGTTTLTHSESFSGILIPFAGSVLDDTEENFHHFNQALKNHIEGKSI